MDKGAIRFVLSGANIMCPGLTSPGGKMAPADKDTVVVSFCGDEPAVLLVLCFVQYMYNTSKTKLEY